MICKALDKALSEYPLAPSAIADRTSSTNAGLGSIPLCILKKRRRGDTKEGRKGEGRGGKDKSGGKGGAEQERESRTDLQERG